MNPHILRIQQQIAPLRQEIINHKVYGVLNSIEHLKVFMEHHVYAVWDFMSLLKTLQQQLTCTTVPWFPKGDAATRYLINEIVVGEESDVDEQGVRISHFELYLAAMQQCDADAKSIHAFVGALQAGHTLQEAFDVAGTPPAARQFVSFTFDIIASKQAYLQSAIFTFGREDLIPGMFVSLIRELHQRFPDDIGIFKYYIERHIEVDGGHHSELALQMTAQLCGDDAQRWHEAEMATANSLRQRIALWDGVYAALH